MSKSLYSGVNKVYFRSHLLLNIVASSACIIMTLVKVQFITEDNSWFAALSSIHYWSLFIICSNLNQFDNYSYIIKVGLGLGKDAKGSFALYNLWCQSLWEKLFYKVGRDCGRLIKNLPIIDLFRWRRATVAGTGKWQRPSFCRRKASKCSRPSFSTDRNCRLVMNSFINDIFSLLRNWNQSRIKGLLGYRYFENYTLHCHYIVFRRPLFANFLPSYVLDTLPILLYG